MVLSTSSHWAELIYDEYIVPLILDQAWNSAVTRPYVLEQDLRGRATGVGSFVQDSAPTISGTAETVAEGSDLTPVVWNPTSVEVTASELGYSLQFTDKGLEDNIFGEDLLLHFAARIQRELAVSFDDDICALFGSFSNSDVGAAGTDLTIANMVSAQHAVKKAGYEHGVGAGVYVLHTIQSEHLDIAQAAVTATTHEQYLVTNLDPGLIGVMGFFKRCPVVSTGNVDYAADQGSLVGAYFINAKLQPTSAAIGVVQARDVKLGLDRSEIGRNSTLVGTARWGAGVINPYAGVAIATDET